MDKAGFELEMILLSLCHKCWDYRRELLCLPKIHKPTAGQVFFHLSLFMKLLFVVCLVSVKRSN